MNTDTVASSRFTRPFNSPRGSRLAWGVFLVSLTYVCLPFFPLAFSEGDDISISLGVYQYEDQCGTPYKLHAQAGLYYLLSLTRSATGVDPQAAFGGWVLVGYALFVSFSAAFVSRVLKISFPLCGIALLLFPETYIASYYLNGNMVAAGFLAVSLWAATCDNRRADVLAGLMFAIAIWIRIDALLLALVYPALLLGPTLRQAARLLLVAACTAAALLVLYWLTGTSLEALRATASHQRATYADLLRTVQVYAVFFPTSVLALLAVGGGVLWRQRPRLVAACVLAILPIAGAFGSSLTTPKYLLFGVPLLALPVGAALVWFIESRSPRAIFLAGACAGLMAHQYLWFMPPMPATVATADYPRLTDAVAATPLAWMHIKARQLAWQRTIRRELQTVVEAAADPLIVTHGFESGELAAYELRRQNPDCRLKFESGEMAANKLRGQYPDFRLKASTYQGEASGPNDLDPDDQCLRVETYQAPGRPEILLLRFGTHADLNARLRGHGIADALPGRRALLIELAGAGPLPQEARILGRRASLRRIEGAVYSAAFVK